MNKLLRKRRVAAWVLLAVFLPMLLLASAHRHEPQASHDVTCYACLHHLPHSGHLSANSATGLSCVLCHFLSLSYVAAIVLAAIVFLGTSLPLAVRQAPAGTSASHASITLRGPPCL